MKPGTLRSTLVLISVTLGAGILLALIFVITKPTIDENVAKKIAVSQEKVFPSGEEFIERTTEDGDVYFDVMVNGATVGRIYRASPSGYGGPMELLIGIGDGRVTGVEIFAMLETPGFGEKVADPSFTDQFVGRRADDPVAIREDIDAVSGATISSRALTKGVREVLDLHDPGVAR